VRRLSVIFGREAENAVEKTCTENDVKKAYKKLALALHPDKKCVYHPLREGFR
jgi:hypothetical protein